MSDQLPRINKNVFAVTDLADESEEMNYWLSQSIPARLNAVEYNRRMVYGLHRTSSRLQRLLETAELA
ncbi:MAG: hypothetical protein PHQ23_04725 [Candidatus Wallbacteria bacterium]|nr:hypothetical protein [Candidatus Wallbacteria bacterium]